MGAKGEGVNYYNEHDPKAAEWLRELIRAGHIPAGEVDTRDIRAVRATDLVQFTQCHFFAGIGGWSLALRLASWPDDEPIWSGSCPCQPFSTVGKQMGRADSRHLWPAFRRLINRGAPPVVIGEQVASAAGREWLAGVRANLETMGYAVGAADLCAAGVGAPHIRQRLFWVADACFQRRQQISAGTPCDEKANGRARWFAGQPHGDNQFAGHGENGGLEHPEINGREQRRAQSGGGSIASGCGLGGVADVQQPGLEGHAGHGDDRHEPGRVGTDATGTIAEGGRAGFWSAYDLIPCADGKARRIEPGTFPLAHGVSGRVGLLRGYGNAIVPQVAAEFIRAYLEAKGDMNP